MVHQLHSGSEESTPEGHQHRPNDCWLPSPHTGRTTQFPLSQKSPEHYKGHPPSRSLPVWTSGRRYRSINTRTNRLKHSSYPTAITTLNATKNIVQWIWMWNGSMQWHKECMSVDVCSYFLCNDCVCMTVCVYVAALCFCLSFLNTEWCADWRAL